jgi:hypothetical protein
VRARVQWIPAFRKTEIALLWALVALIGWLQMQHKHLGSLTSQGADVVAPALLFVLTREGKSLLRFVGLRQDRPALIATAFSGFLSHGRFAKSSTGFPECSIQWTLTRMLPES